MAGGQGGKRAGAGRKPGIPNGTRALRREARQKLAQLVGSSADPLQFVCETACNPDLDVELRLHAASVALPYLHPRLSAMATVSSKAPEGSEAAAVLETVLGRIARLAPTVTIEAELRAETDEQSEDGSNKSPYLQGLNATSASLCPQDVR